MGIDQLAEVTIFFLISDNNPGNYLLNQIDSAIIMGNLNFYLSLFVYVGPEKLHWDMAS